MHLSEEIVHCLSKHWICIYKSACLGFGTPNTPLKGELIYVRERNNGVLIYFSPNELAQLDEKVKKTNYTRTQFIRSVIADVKIKEAPPTDFFILIREIRRVGNNINQLLALANSKGLIISDELRSSLDKLDKTVQMMWDTFRSEIA